MKCNQSRIWTCITVSISYDYNHYTTGLSINESYLMPNPFFYTCKQFYFKLFSWDKVHSLNVIAVLFQAILFNISTLFSPISRIDRTRLGATTPGYNRPESDGNKGVLRISQTASIIGSTPSDCLVSYIKDTRWGTYPTAEMRSVCPSAPADWTNKNQEWGWV